jgi:hypothetical protein
MSLCRNGHDKDAVGRRGDGTCRQCLSERDRCRKRPPLRRTEPTNGAVVSASFEPIELDPVES